MMIMLEGRYMLRIRVSTRLASVGCRGRDTPRPGVVASLLHEVVAERRAEGACDVGMVGGKVRVDCDEEWRAVVC